MLVPFQQKNLCVLIRSFWENISSHLCTYWPVHAQNLSTFIIWRNPFSELYRYSYKIILNSSDQNSWLIISIYSGLQKSKSTFILNVFVLSQPVFEDSFEMALQLWSLQIDNGRDGKNAEAIQHKVMRVGKKVVRKVLHFLWSYWVDDDNLNISTSGKLWHAEFWLVDYPFQVAL